jgi:hypothetical protein
VLVLQAFGRSRPSLCWPEASVAVITVFVGHGFFIRTCIC